MGKIFKNPFDPAEQPQNFRQWYHENVQMPQALRAADSQVSAAVIMDLQQTIRTIEESTCWRLTAPLRKFLDALKQSKVFILLKKTVKNYREYGLRWTLRKIVGYLSQNGKPITKEEVTHPPKKKNDLQVSRALIDQLYSSKAGKTFCYKDIVVGVPVYNGLKHLKKLLPSLVKNTPEEVELLFVDDASPDAEVFPYLQSMADKYSRIKLMRNKKNLGFVKTANKILKTAAAS